MSVEENKALYRSLVEEVLNKGNLEALSEYMSLNVVDHGASASGLPPGREGIKQALGAFLTAFPDLKLTIEEVIAEGDKVVGRVTFRGTHKGEFMGISPTGKEITVESIEINRISDGKFVEHWEVFDQLGMMQQLGIVSLPEEAK